MVRVLFFGRLRDIAGASEIDVADGGGSVAELRALLNAENPGLGDALGSPEVRVAIDQIIAGDDASIEGAREIAFMPPLSGG